jgi:hypothetical protein
MAVAVLSALVWGAGAAIVVDDSGLLTTFSSNTTQSITISANPDRLLVVTLCSEWVSIQDVVSMQYGGQDMTLGALGYINDTQLRHWLYYLTNPASGSNDLVVTMAEDDDAHMGYWSAYNVLQTDPIVQTNVVIDTNSDIPSDASTNILSGVSAGNLVLATLADGGAAFSISPSANSAFPTNDFEVFDVVSIGLRGGTAVPGVAGDVTTEWAWNEGDAWRTSHVAVEFAQIPEPATLSIFALGAVMLLLRRRIC